RVWSLWRDPNNWSAWNSGIASARVDGPIANGAKGTMTTNRGSTHDVEFSNVVEGRGFSMTMAGPPLTTITFTCAIAPDGSGSTIAQHAAIAGPLGFIFGPVMGNEMAKHFVPVLDDLARAAEA
ncbi:MAG TPA: SRPBCC family protein, partial [Candidatus Acidoferrales bacterium]|nr:SRPBCC family protein [Candidatus Acidoferrales bacterium]